MEAKTILIDVRHNPEPATLPMIKALRKAHGKATGGKETRLV